MLVLRGIEGLPAATVAERLGQKRSTVSMRYSRALTRLRDCLPSSFVTELLGVGA